MPITTTGAGITAESGEGTDGAYFNRDYFPNNYFYHRYFP